MPTLIVNAGEGNDIVGGPATATVTTMMLNGETGADVMLNGHIIRGGDDNDSIWCEDTDPARYCTLWGGEGDDWLSCEGNDAACTLEGEGGIDELDGSLFDDSLDGGEDPDEIYGNSGEDYIWGGDETDFGEGDYIEGGADADHISGGLGDDEIWAAGLTFPGDFDDGENLRGDGGNDIIGTLDNDTLQGNAGSDTIYGFFGLDVITGGTGDDFVNSGDGADNVDGGAGDDVLCDSDSNTQTADIDSLIRGGIGVDDGWVPYIAGGIPVFDMVNNCGDSQYAAAQGCPFQLSAKPALCPSELPP